MNGSEKILRIWKRFEKREKKRAKRCSKLFFFTKGNISTDVFLINLSEESDDTLKLCRLKEDIVRNRPHLLFHSNPTTSFFEQLLLCLTCFPASVLRNLISHRLFDLKLLEVTTSMQNQLVFAVLNSEGDRERKFDILVKQELVVLSNLRPQIVCQCHNLREFKKLVMLEKTRILEECLLIFLEKKSLGPEMDNIILFLMKSSYFLTANTATMFLQFLLKNQSGAILQSVIEDDFVQNAVKKMQNSELLQLISENPKSAEIFFVLTSSNTLNLKEELLTTAIEKEYHAAIAGLLYARCPLPYNFNNIFEAVREEIVPFLPLDKHTVKFVPKKFKSQMRTLFMVIQRFEKQFDTNLRMDLAGYCWKLYE